MGRRVLLLIVFLYPLILGADHHGGQSDCSYLSKLKGDYSKVKKLIICLAEDMPQDFAAFKSLEEVVSMTPRPAVKVHPSIVNAPKLRVLSLAGTTDTTLPKDIHKLQTLEEFEVMYMGFQTLPDGFFKLKNMKRLYLDGTSLQTISPKIGNFSKLEKLVISGPGLKSIPQEIGNLKNLEHLSLTLVKMQTAPGYLPSLTKLKILDLSSNPLTDLPDSFARLRNLKKLCIRKTKIQTVPKVLLKMPNLKEVYAPDSLLKYRGQVPFAIKSDVMGCSRFKN